MEELASIVTDRVIIYKMTPANQLSSILASVQCIELRLRNIDLSEADTRALVTAMRDRVQTVWLGDVTLDIKELVQYNGQGRCSGMTRGAATGTG